MQPQGDRPITFSFRVEHLLGWSVTIFLCLLPVYMWAQLNPISEINNFSAVMINLGRVTGLVGMVMYALNLVYSTRLRFLEYFFGGLNRVYIAHHILGGLALIFLSLHPFFLALRLVQISLLEVTMFLLPNGLTPVGALFDPNDVLHSQVLQQWALTFGIVAFWGMVGLLLLTFFIKVPYKFWLATHKYLGWFFVIGGLHLVFITSDTSVSGPLRTYMLIMTGIGVAAFFYRSLVGKILIRHYKYVVRYANFKADKVLSITLAPTDSRIDFKPGQFLFIRFLDAPGISREWHPFSIASSSTDSDITVVIKSLGDYTAQLHNLPSGTTAEIEGAYGMFSYRSYSNKNQIWIAGGIGITPFLSMARSLPQDGQYNIDLYYSVRTASEVIEWQTLAELAQAHSGHFRVFPFVSEQQKGRLSADFIESIGGSVTGKDVYICGPAPMMKALRQQFKDKGTPGTNIHTEEFSMS